MSRQPRSDALSRIQTAARLVEYDLWFSWPIEDERPGVIDDYMPWMDELALELVEPDGPELVTSELVRLVIRTCAPSLDPYVRLVVWARLADRVDRNLAIARALTTG